MRSILLSIPATLAMALIAGSASGQAASQSFRLTAGGFVGAGGTASSGTRALVGAAVPSPAGGVSTSTNAREIGGPLAALPQAPAVQVLASQIETGVFGGSYGINAVVRSGPRAALQLQYCFGGALPLASVAMTATSAVDFTGEIPAADMGVRGVEYRIEARQNGLVRRFGASPVGSRYAVRTALSNQRGPALPDASFRMIGFPFDVAFASPAGVFEDDLGAPDARLWRVGRWDPAMQAVVEHPNFGAVARGQGFWAIARGAKSIGADGLSALPDTVADGARYGKLVLQPGWNQIASPFAFPVEWGARIVDPRGGIDASAWGFDGASYESVALLQPFEGYFVFNAAAATRTLLLPYFDEPIVLAQASAAVASTFQNTRGDLWSLRLSATSGDRADRDNRVGAAPDALDGWDPLDAAEPPPNSLDQWLSLGFAAPDASAPLLAVDRRAPGAAGWQFELRVRGNTGRPVQLQAAQLATLPAGQQALLVARADGRRWELNPASATVTLPAAHPEGDAYVLLVGGSDYVTGRLQSSELLPQRYVLFANRPNPFNPSTALRFALPEAQHARLEIFDVAGRRVATLLDAQLAPGFHELRWDGRDGSGNAVASGAYVVRLTAGSFVQSRKMLLVK